jgi:triphosphoribosyl-dephospho-CoA synthetase
MSHPPLTPLDTLAADIRLACLLEATARKPGNVHPGHSFTDLNYGHFVTAAEVASPWLARAGELGVGEAIYRAAVATHEATGTNANLGILLLIAPLAAVPAGVALEQGCAKNGGHSLSLTEDPPTPTERPSGGEGWGEGACTVPPHPGPLPNDQTTAESASRQWGRGRDPTPAAFRAHTSLRAGLPDALAGLRVADAVSVVRAIQLMNPGGLGSAAEQDVASLPTLPLVELMALAQDRDRIARQYAVDFSDLFDTALPLLLRSLLQFPHDWNSALIQLQLDLLTRWPDSHIARRCGIDVASEVSRRAAEVLDCGWPATEQSLDRFREFESWMQDAAHRHNPGTTADLIAATLFIALRERRIRDESLAAAQRFVGDVF